jgi:hypothetical protein
VKFIWWRIKIALRLRHLLALDQQEAHMHPVPREGFSGGRLRLCNLVFVVRKHQVLAAGVQVEAVAQQACGHGRALDVPPRTARPQRRIPMRFVWLDGFPQRKVPRRVLLILVHIHARAVFNAVEVLLGQLAVVRIARDAEVPASILGLVGDVLGGEALDQRDHLGNVFGGAGQMLGPLDGERVQIFKEGFLEAGGILGDRLAGGERVADDLVVHVGYVHYVLDRHALLTQKPPQHVHMEEGAEVANVAVVVHGWPARIHPQSRRADRLQPLQFAAHCVEKF